MTPSPSWTPLTDTYCFAYVECDVPAGVTLDEWRRRPRPAASSTWTSLLARLRRVRTR
jgi:hypothetical protein